MSASPILSAVSRGIARTLADGTVRVTIEIEPADALRAMQMLGMPGLPIAIVRLAHSDPLADPEPPPAISAPPKAGKPATGPLCRSAGILCNDEKFQRFCLAMIDNNEVGIPLGLRLAPPEEAAAEVIRAYCVVASRRDIDGNPDAKLRFAQLMANYRSFLDAADE